MRGRFRPLKRRFRLKAVDETRAQMWYATKAMLYYHGALDPRFILWALRKLVNDDVVVLMHGASREQLIHWIIEERDYVQALALEYHCRRRP